MKCDFCGSEEQKKIYNHTRFKKNNVLACQNCGLVFLVVKKSKTDIEDFYRNDYRAKENFPAQTAQEHFDYPVTQQDSRVRTQWLQKSVSLRGLKVLEIGSASGHLLKTLADCGADVTGVELTKDYVDFSRALGLKIFDRPLEESGFKNQFDLVIIFHALEHITDPKQFLKAIHLSLKPGGRFMGEVPNQNDWRLKIFDNDTVKRFHYDPCHYFYFSPKTLTNYLESANFQKISLETVERYNSLLQLERILSGAYDDTEKALKKDIFAKPSDDLRLKSFEDKKQNTFNRIFEKAVNAELLGNCLRWTAYK